jgi:hypothetical protein
MNRIVIGMTSVLALAVCAGTSAADIDWSRVDQALGKKGSDLPGGVHRYALPRSDLNVAVDGVAIRPALALGSWVAFQPTADGGMFMGDLVLTDTEISPVMQRLMEGGVEITAVHNHLLRTSVPVFYMHVGGHGDPVKLAEALHAGLALSKTPFTQASPSPAPAPLELDAAAIEKTLGYKGTANGGSTSSAFRCRSEERGRMGRILSDAQRTLGLTPDRGPGFTLQSVLLAGRCDGHIDYWEARPGRRGRH